MTTAVGQDSFPLLQRGIEGDFYTMQISCQYIDKEANILLREILLDLFYWLARIS
jgi:hypothetical protein